MEHLSSAAQQSDIKSDAGQPADAEKPAKAMATTQPFVIGLIRGQFIPASLLNIWCIPTQTPTYQFWQ